MGGAGLGTLWLGFCLALWLSACAHTPPREAPVLDQVLAEEALRTQLVKRGAADAHFVHEILHQLGHGPEGEQKFARLLAEHLGHHPTTAHAMFQELAQQQQFHEWLIEQVRKPRGAPES